MKHVQYQFDLEIRGIIAFAFFSIWRNFDSNESLEPIIAGGICPAPADPGVL